MWTDPGLRSGISVRELISTSIIMKIKNIIIIMIILINKRRRGMNGRTVSQNPRKRGRDKKKKKESRHHHSPLSQDQVRFLPKCVMSVTKQ